MSSATTRTSSLPLLLTMLAAFATAILPQRWALAQSTPPPPSPTDPISDGTGGPSSLALPTPGAETPDAQTTVDLKTGAATSRFAFELPKARGDAQPTLALAYSSAVGTGFAGVGWTLSLPSIVRKGAAGLPRFTDDVFTASAAALAAPTATFDEYLADGQLLVPICGVSTCGPQLQPGERLPSSLAGTSLTGWMYFRREVDDGARYFFSPDGQTWLKQEKSGHVTQFGHPLDGVPTLTDGIERPAPFTNLPSQTSLATAVYRWNIVREADASGNTVYYAWTNNASLAPGGTVPDIQYLSDVYDTLAPGRAPAPTAFAHHVHLTWTLNFPLPSVFVPDPPVPPPPDAHNVPTPWNPTFSSVTPPIQIVNPIWRAVPFAQLATLDVTSASWSSSSRALVRRYSLGYQSNTWTTRNRLSGITLEGECEATGGAPAPIAEVNNVVPNPSGCGSPTTLQLATYDYYPDTIGGGAPQFTTLGTAFASSNLDPPNIPSDNLIQNVTGDGAADYVSVPLTGSGFSVQSFSSTTSTSLSASDTARLVPSYAPQSCYSTGNGPNGELNGTCLTFHPLMFGDWLANGSVNWLTFDGPSVTQGPPTAGAWNAYTPLADSFVPPSVNAGLCDVSDYCDSGRAFDVDGDGLTDMGLIPNSTMSAAFITQRAHDGSIAPFSTMTPLFGDWGPPDTDLVLPFKSVADLDGDGLSDILAVRGMYPFGAAKDGFTSGTDMI